MLWTVRWMSGAAALMMLPAMAQAAPACPVPEAPAARVCTNPALAKLANELAAKEKAVEAASSRPSTWAARTAGFLAYTATEKDGDDKLLGAEDLKARFTDHIRGLDEEIAQAKTVRADAGEADILGEKCLASWLALGCKVPAAGILRDEGVRILWQLQDGASEDDGGAMGAMLWDATAPGKPRLIGWTFEGVWMRDPRYGAESQLLWVPGTMSGTGEGNADLLFQKQGDRWVSIELESWRDELAKRLPKGLGAWHGVEYDLTSLGGATELWRESDANCCPTGGRANLSFKVEGASLRLDGLQVQEGGPDKEWKDY